ncbi:MAG: 1-(5-phosphoribosyl)-5-[(5-phosphoribosylamino)methylideneamino]imidazole-4-carboxamide isomerase [Planctomycetota bacterium]
MEIWPAIDLRGGNCVRLEQGDYDRETVFSGDPVAMARHWQDAGATNLHLVDLDGARDGSVANRESIRDIVAATSMTCEVGGGIRSEETIRDLIDMGVQRLVVGTQALKQPDWFKSMCLAYPDRLVLGLDARGGMIATDGWLETSQTSAIELAEQFADLPIAAIVYTDIATDGMLSGPNLNETRAMAEAVSIPVVASGGVSSVEDISELAKLPIAGAIIGRALYDGKVDMEGVLAASRR